MLPKRYDCRTTGAYARAAAVYSPSTSEETNTPAAKQTIPTVTSRKTRFAACDREYGIPLIKEITKFAFQGTTANAIACAIPTQMRTAIRYVRLTGKLRVSEDDPIAFSLTRPPSPDRKSTRLNSSHANISYA